MIVLLPCYSLEDFSIYRAEEEAGEIFSAFSAAYHPALIEALGKTPRWERAGNPTANIPHRLVIIPPCCESKVPRQWLKNAEESGVVIVRDKSTREEIAAEALENSAPRRKVSTRTTSRPSTPWATAIWPRNWSRANCAT
ncbi:MAG: hypothetical protein IJG25_02620 [Thermoguttaceae bacterium]|nr:hypothetical protein [Thermoguttaceae bacterium]